MFFKEQQKSVSASFSGLSSLVSQPPHQNSIAASNSEAVFFATSSDFDDDMQMSSSQEEPYFNGNNILDADDADEVYHEWDVEFDTVTQA